MLKKRKANAVVLIWLFVALLIVLIMVRQCTNQPPVETQTPTPTAYYTLTPTKEYPTVYPVTWTPTPTSTKVLEPTATMTPSPTPTLGPNWVEISVPYDMSVWFRSCPSTGCVSIYPVNTIHNGERVIWRQCANPAGYMWVEVWYGTVGYVYSDYVRPDVCRIR